MSFSMIKAKKISGLLIAAMAIVFLAYAAFLPGGATLRAIVYSPPETEIVSGPDFWTNDPTVDYEFSSDQQLAKFQCRWFEGSWFSCPDSFSSAKKDDGYYKFSVRATQGGRTDPTPEVDYFNIDTKNPQTTISGPDSTFDTSPTFRLSSNEEEVSLECSIDGGAWEDCSSPWSRELSYGSHYLRARATDRAGNIDSTPARKDFRIRRDTTPPQTSISGPDKTKDRAPSFRLGSNEDGVTFECSLNGSAWAPCSRNYKTPTLSLGSHRLRARATDKAGNTDPRPAVKQFRITR